jgi:hypothetical protein
MGFGRPLTVNEARPKTALVVVRVATLAAGR